MADAATLPTSAAQALTPAAPPPAPIAPVKKDTRPDPIQQIMDENKKISDQETKSLGEINTKIMQFKPPELPKIPPKPQQQQTTPIDAWGSAAMVFAALAPMFVRSHATTAMNAAANAMKGIQQRDEAQTKYNFEVWKQETQNAIDMSNFQWKSYEALMGNLKFEAGVVKDMSEEKRKTLEGEVKALNFAFQNAGAIEAYKQNGLEGVADFNKTFKNSSVKLQEEMLKVQGMVKKAQDDASAKQIIADPANKDIPAADMVLKLAPYSSTLAGVYQHKATEDRLREKEESDVHVQAQRAAKDKIDEIEAAAGKPLTAVEKNKVRMESYGQFQSKNGRMYPDPSTLEPAEQGALKQSFKYYEQQFPTVSQQRGNLEAWEKLAAEIKKEDPNWNAARFKVVQTARNNIQNGKDKDAIASFVRLHEHEEVVRSLIKARRDGADEKALNRLASWWAEQTGDTNITSLKTSLVFYGDELAKAVVGSGAASALGDRELNHELFSPSLSNDQLFENIETADRMVGGAIVSKLAPYRNSGMQPHEISDAVGIDPQVLQSQYHVDPNIFQPTNTGKFKLGNAEVEIGKEGVGLTPEAATPAQAAPAQAAALPSGAKMLGTRKDGVAVGEKDGKRIWLMNGQWLDESGSPVQ
jgi:hypothetical protein